MPKATNIKFNHFVKAVEYIAQQHFAIFKKVQKRGSGIRFEVFEDENDKVPSKMWVVHEDKVVYSRDLSKTCENLGVSEGDFKALFKKGKFKP